MMLLRCFQYSFCMALDLQSVMFTWFMVRLVMVPPSCGRYMACAVLLVICVLFMVVLVLVPPIQMACAELLLILRLFKIRLSQLLAYTA